MILFFFMSILILSEISKMNSDEKQEHFRDQRIQNVYKTIF
jgi:hypothetical protein